MAQYRPLPLDTELFAVVGPVGNQSWASGFARFANNGFYKSAKQARDNAGAGTVMRGTIVWEEVPNE